MKYLFIISFFLIASCTTPYQKQTWYAYRGGYSETKLSDNSFLVVFNGNGWTDSNKVFDFALRRSAEITLENGFNYFIIDKQSNDKLRQQTYSQGLAGAVAGQLIPRPSSSHVIICYKERPEDTEDLRKIYDAQVWVKKIKSRYKPIFSKND